MPSPADQALCARDPALPGLAAVLDADRLSALAGQGALRPIYLRYKPGTSCVLGVVAEDGAVFAAMTYPPARYAEVRARRSWWTGPDAVRFLDAICTALVPLSRDRHLKAARALRTPGRRQAFLQALGLEGAALTVLRYKPGRRLVMRADLPSGRVALIKAHGTRDFAGALAGAHHAGPPPMAVSRRFRCIVLPWIPGEVLDPARHGPEGFHQAGALIARLHGMAVPAELRPDAPDPRADAAAMAALLPDLAVAATADAVARALPGSPICAIHGDFSADQVVIGADGPRIIDWDRLAAGHPARDLGRFLARLDADAAMGTITPEVAQAAGTALLHGYGTVAALPDGIAPCRAAALLALLPEGFRARRPDWPALARALADRAALLVTPGLDRAQDGDAMAGPLAQALRRPQADRPAVTLLRHKPGRRALLRYDLPGAAPILGKLRAKGPDRRTPALHGALRDAGLDGTAETGVPAALAEMGALWLQEMVPGRVLTDLLRPGGPTDAARLAGRALARLHGVAPGALPASADRRWTLEDEYRVLDRALGQAATADPPAAPRIAGIRDAARQALAALPPEATVGIHRDFYPDQILIDGGRAWILDLDLFTQGDAAIDLGNFLAHLDEQGLRLHGSITALEAQGEAFLSGYAALRPMDRPRIALLRRVSLARHIWLSRIIPGRAGTTEALVKHCAGWSWGLTEGDEGLGAFGWTA